MKYVFAFLLLAGCASERELLRSDPVPVIGAAAVFATVLATVTLK
jgi:hypothetical protein